MSATDRRSTTRRSVGWPALLGLLVSFALLPAFFGVIVLHRSGGSVEFPDQESVSTLAGEKVFELGLVVLAITWLRWWPVVLHERHRVRRWVWLVPGTFLLASIAMVDYSRLREAGILLAATLVLSILLIAVSEELMFRGLVLTFLRDRAPEWVAAVGSSVLFGLFHVPAGPINVVSSMVFGYLLYYTRRVSGGLLVPIVIHAAWDVAVFSGLTTATPATDSATGFTLVLVMVALLIVMVAGRRAAEPAPAEPAA